MAGGYRAHTQLLTVLVLAAAGLIKVKAKGEALLRQQDSDGSNCSDVGPGDCTFADTFCQWSQENWTISKDYVTVSHSGGTRRSATLRSRVVCAASPSHCLRFHFYAYDSSPGGTLDVIVEELGGDDGHTEWRIEPTNSTLTWQAASVPIFTRSEFRVVFQARWDADRYPVISLRNVTYNDDDDDAACERTPSWATVLLPGGGSEVSTTTQGTSEGVSEGCCWVQFVVPSACFVLLAVMSE
ncbi:uncharacterized protein LOC143286131 [Babylonia areolata]|uniref:uncharacterized protein LOC143286131 n=1 Tax=Babylonia areolata TaxID=304850 RepID=UPI003FD27AE9